MRARVAKARHRDLVVAAEKRELPQTEKRGAPQGAAYAVVAVNR